MDIDKTVEFLFACFAGAIVMLIVKRPKRFLDWLAGVVVGVAVAYFLAPLVVASFPKFDLSTAGFILGMAGKELIERGLSGDLPFLGKYTGKPKDED